MSEGTSAGLLREVLHAVLAHGDLAHLVLFLWAGGASALLVWALRELVASNQRFDAFVKAIASINRLFPKND